VRDSEPLDAVDFLLRTHQPAAAVSLLEAIQQRRPLAWSWPLAERAGAAYLRLGRPADARRVWQQATAAPSESLRQSRLADTYWIEEDFATAARLYSQATAADPIRGEAWWALAMIRTQSGQAAEAVAACRQGLKCSLPDPLRSEMQSLEMLLASHTEPAR
jgi:tetratricopeptide (TPR) repeat protein